MHPLAQLYQSLTVVAPQLVDIEAQVLARRLPHTVQMTDAQASYDDEKAQLYFRLYTVPVLEYAGLLQPNRRDEAIRWGIIQCALGMHIRYIDKVIDGDTPADHFHEVQCAHYYLLAAISFLGECGCHWNHAAQAIYSQFLQYESELRAGYRHSYGSLWRRVSPLCVVPTVYASVYHNVTHQDQWFRDYLSWSLLRADCDDVFSDLHSHTKTPVAHLLQEAWTHTYHDASVAHDVLMRMMRFLEQKRQLLTAEINGQYPLWSICVDHLQQSHGDSVKVL